tara:strand:+ start:710 stop:823 length:114 start_codon:yes stop_codon:yes gene_type:complete
MAQSTYKKQQKKEARDTFFLYVFFHSIWSGIINMFED